MTTDNKQTNLRLVREFSSGGCVYKKMQERNIVWLLGKHSGYHKWVLPKGLIEKGEKGIETAVRETKEEMGVVGRVVGDKPIHIEKYWFVAELKKGEKQGIPEKNEPVRRVEKYQEDEDFAQSRGERVRVFKTVSFYLMEWVSGDPADHDWEMEEACWHEADRALELLAFEGERQALRAAIKAV